MAHFAELDANNIVLRVIVVGNDMLLDDNGQENEFRGVAFCRSLFGEDTNWMQTSYNGNFRKNYCGPGFTYDQARDAFIPPMPEGQGWILDEETLQWKNPELEAAQAAVTIGVTRV